MRVGMIEAKKHLHQKTGYSCRYVKSTTENFTLHYHDYYELFLTIKGKGKHKVNSQVQTLLPSRLLFVRDFDMHEYVKIQGEDFEFINLSFSKDTFDEMFEFFGDDLPTADGDLKPTQFRITDKETLKKIYRDSGIALSGSECTAGVCRFRITPTGDVNPGEMMHHVVFGNLHKQSFSDILKSDVHMEWLEFFDKLKKEHNCGKCENKKWCSLCPGLFYEETGSYDTPSPYTCMITQIKKELMLNE